MNIPQLVSSVGGIAGIAGLITVIVYYIESFRITEIERKLMPTSKKLAYNLSFIFINSIIITFLISTFQVLEEPIKVNELICIFVISIIVFSIAVIGLMLIFKRKLKNTKFNIELKENEDTWEIMRATHAGALLVERNNVYKIIKSYENLPITMEKCCCCK